MRAWRWATFIMHDLCGIRAGNYDSFHWKQTIFGEKIPKQVAEKIKIWHLLYGFTLWTTLIEHNNRVFNQEQWPKTKVNHFITGGPHYVRQSGMG